MERSAQCEPSPSSNAGDYDLIHTHLIRSASQHFSSPRAGPVAQEVDSPQHFTGLGEAHDERLVAPGTVGGDVMPALHLQWSGWECRPRRTWRC